MLKAGIFKQLVPTAATATRIAGRRCLCAAAAKHVKMPMQLFGVSGRYANALYVTAVKTDSLKKVEEELNTFKQAIDTNANLKRFCVDPSISRKNKGDTMATILKDNSEVTRKFVGVLCDGGRMDQFEDIIKDFNLLLSAHKKEVSATVVTTVELAPKQVTAVKEALKGFIAADETILLKCVVDQSIMGGMVVSVGDRRIDLSVLRTLDELQRKIEEPVM